MESRTINKLREEERRSFLKMDPVERILTMERVLYEIISLRSQEEGVSEGEIYNRYLASRKKRHR